MRTDPIALLVQVIGGYVLKDQSFQDRGIEGVTQVEGVTQMSLPTGSKGACLLLLKSSFSPQGGNILLTSDVIFFL